MKRFFWGLIISFLLAAPGYGTDGGGLTEVSGRIPLNEKEEMAVAATFAGTVVTRKLQDQHLEAALSGHDANGCSLVTVTALTTAWKEINRYRICNGLITEERRLESEVSEKESFEDFIQEIAGKARQFGMAQGVFKKLTVKAARLSTGNTCAVEVGVYKDRKLTREETFPCN